MFKANKTSDVCVYVEREQMSLETAWRKAWVDRVASIRIRKLKMYISKTPAYLIAPDKSADVPLPASLPLDFETIPVPPITTLLLSLNAPCEGFWSNLWCYPSWERFVVMTVAIEQFHPKNMDSGSCFSIVSIPPSNSLKRRALYN